MGIEYVIEMRIKNFPIPSDSNDKLMLAGMVMGKISEVIEQTDSDFESSVVGLKADGDKYTGRLTFPKIEKGSNGKSLSPMNVQSGVIKFTDLEIKAFVGKEERLWQPDIQILKIW